MKVSVVIPTKNRAALLPETIHRIESQTFPRAQYEVVIIDNDSSDDTRKVLEQRSRTFPNLRIGFQPKPGAAAARNAGLRMATGELVLFIDDDIRAEETLIQRHVDYHNRIGGASVIGSITIPWGDTTEPFWRYLRDHRIFNPYTPSNGPIDFSYYHTCNASTRTDLLLKVGGFNENFTIYGMEDIELGYRLEQSGSSMIFAPEAKAIHHRFPEYRDFVERCEDAGYSLGQMLVLHPELKDRFIKGGRLTRHLKNFHTAYRFFAAGASPFVKVLMQWEKRRGGGSVTRLLDAHYNWSIRYHFFLGYRRYLRIARQSPNRGLPIQPSPGKEVLE